MENVMLKKENGETYIKEYDLDLISNMRCKGTKPNDFIHMCWQNCQNACSNKCDKIYDSKKKPISEYDFITDGLQQYDDDGNLEVFIVSKCNNYEVEKEKRALSKKKLREMKESLMVAYFNETSLSEAEQLQENLFSRGLLVNSKNIRRK